MGNSVGKQEPHRDDVAPVAVSMTLQGSKQDAQRHLMAVGPMQRVAAVLGPAGLPIVPAQHCTPTNASLSKLRYSIH